MSLNSLVTPLGHIGADLIAITFLVGVLYARRHSGKDLIAAYIGVNIGVLAVTLLLSTADIGAGLGLGLFGVLSIIRLRSTQLTQHEVAYFFAALALGLLGGIQTAPLPLDAALMALVVASLWIGDHPALMRRHRHQTVLLDRAISDEQVLTRHLEQVLGGARIRSLEIQRLDLVNDTTQVDMRIQLPRGSQGARTAPAAAPTDPAKEQPPVSLPGAAPWPNQDPPQPMSWSQQNPEAWTQPPRRIT